MDIDFTPQHVSFSFKLLKRIIINNRIKNFMKQMQRVIAVVNRFFSNRLLANSVLSNLKLNNVKWG